MNEGSNRFGIAVLTGSVRPNNFTRKAAAIVVDELEQHSVPVTLLDPGTMNLPLPGMSAAESRATEMQDVIKSAAGVILATPEYHGSFSSVMKLAIENMGFPSVLAGKPVALLGVAAGRIGAIKALEHLRSVVSHVGGIVLPGPVSVAGVKQYFDEQGRVTDQQIDGSIRRLATNLVEYVEQSVCPRRCLEEIVREEAA